VKLDDVAGVGATGAAAITFASIVTSASRGGRQTVSLQAW
jgi:hypothetical protein